MADGGMVPRQAEEGQPHADAAYPPALLDEAPFFHHAAQDSSATRKRDSGYCAASE
jgi:hypothetical protein